MHLDPYIVLGSAVVGLLVGLTGAGGGALMTPMLILLFGVKPSSAISSDLVAAVVMRPFGAAVHLYKKTVNLRLVGWMVCGSVPMALVGAFLLNQLGESSTAQSNVERFLGAALLAGAAAMVFRYWLDRRSGQSRIGLINDLQVKPLPTIGIGMIGGLIVGMTSVGSGSLMIVLLLFLYPLISANALVGTDLTQAVPLTAAAALGALIFGSVEFGVTFSIIIGAVPAVLVGSFLSSRAPDRYIRPIITFVIFASGLKYIGVGTTALGWILCAVLLAGAVYWLVRTQPWRNGNGRLAFANGNGGRRANGSASGHAASGASGHAASGHAASGHAASGHAASGHAANGAGGHAASGASGHAASGHAASGHAASGHAAHAASGHAASGHAAHAASGHAASAAGGHAASGQAANGASGHAVNGQAANGQAPHGQAAEQEAAGPPPGG